MLVNPIVEELILSMIGAEPMPIQIRGFDPIVGLQRIIDEINAPAPPAIEWTST